MRLSTFALLFIKTAFWLLHLSYITLLLMSQKASQRPFVLDPLFRSVTSLAGVGPKNAKLLEKLTGGEKLLDLLWHLPIDYIDRRYTPKLSDAKPGRIATLSIQVDRHMPAARRGLPYKVRCFDGTGSIDLVFFNATKDWINKQLPPGANVIVSGKLESYQDRLQMVHPDAIGGEEDRDAIETVEPVYPLTAGLTNRTLRKSIENALGPVPKLPEWLDEAYQQKNSWTDWHYALNQAHHLEDEKGLLPQHPARMRLAYDELLSNQLALALMRLHQRKIHGRAFTPSTILREKGILTS